MSVTFDSFSSSLPFPQAALLDQLTGSTTLVASIPGAAEPGTPASEEYVKAHAYFPGSIVGELAQQNRTDSIPDLMQAIIRELGVPTLRRFERCVAKLRKGVRRPRATLPRPLPEIEGIPDSIPYGSSRYVFYGRKLRGWNDEYQGYGTKEGAESSKEDQCDSEATLSSSHTRAQEGVGDECI